MKILNLVKSEFIKNYTVKKIIAILIVLMIAVIGVTEFRHYYYQEGRNIIKVQLKENEEQYAIFENSKDLDIERQKYAEYKQFVISNKMELLELVENRNISSYSSWQNHLIGESERMNKELYFIENKLNNEETYISIEYYDEAQPEVKKLQELSDEELLKCKEEMLKEQNNILELLKENKFYKFAEYLIKSGHRECPVEFMYLDRYYRIDEDKKAYYQSFIDLKIEDENDYRVKNFYQLFNIRNWGFGDEYVNSLVDEKQLEYQEILKYSLKHNKKHDIVYQNEVVNVNSDYFYTTSKTIVNQATSLFITMVVIVLVIISSGNTMSSEHILGTEKMLMTSPNKRWKILLSKFIYMILNMYIIWFTVLILLSIYAGIKYGFNDLFTPKLIYQNGVVEVNYYLYIIKEIFYVSIPVIALISIILMLSTITLNTSLTVGITMVISILSAPLWYIIQQFKLYILAYTPLPYFVYSQVVHYNKNFLRTMATSNINLNTGIIVSLITIAICYLIAHIIYTKRDVKN